MAVIFYGVQGEGLGHATRCKTTIEHLMKKHKVIILCGGRAYQYLSNHFTDVIRITSPHIFYKGDRVSNLRTFFLNLFKFPNFIKSYLIAKKAAKENKPDVIITDFEPITSYYGLLNKIPVVSVDNQHVITNSEVEFPSKKYSQYARTKLIVKLMIWKAKKYFMINFFFPPIKKENSYFVKPIIRKEIQKLKPRKKNFILVYQTSFTNTKLVPALISAEEKMVVYGHPTPGQQKNLRFVEFNENKFFSDLRDCKAVITNGGQSLMQEAIYLKKPVLSVPVENQFEQYLNAEYLQKLGFGEMHKKLDGNKIKTFLKRIPAYEKNLKKTNMIGNSDLFRMLDVTIEELSSKK